MIKLIKRNLLLAVLLLAGAFCSGCVTTYKLKLKPVTEYPAVEPVDMSVGLLLEGEFAGEKRILFERFDGLRLFKFQAPGPALGDSAESLLRAAFREVHPVKSSSAADFVPPTCSAIIKPHVLKFEDEVGVLAANVIVYLEWTVTKPNGDLVWKKAFRGEGSGGVLPKTQVQRALEAAFATSFTNIHHAPAIRALAAPPSNSASRPGASP